MGRLILVSATALEIAPAITYLERFRSPKPYSYVLDNLEVEVCITGVGMVNTAFELGRQGLKDYHYALNAGVCGSFGLFKTGQVVSVIKDRFPEMGAENDRTFITVDELGLGKQSVRLDDALQLNVSVYLPPAIGITVNTVHGNEESIKKVMDLCHADVESMEGAAFIHAANVFGWKALQLRAVSNRVEKRNKENWDLPLAIKNLNEIVIQVLEELSTK